MATRGQTIRCRGAVCWSPGEPLVIQEIDVAPPQEWEVRIKIICTSICHTDLKYWESEAPFLKFPKILGHEAVGVVESVGESVREVREGDRVIPSFLPTCGECVGCRSEKGNYCFELPFLRRNGMLRDDTSRFSTADGTTVSHFFCISSFAEYTVVDVASVVKVDFDIPPEEACLLGCGVTTGYGAAWKAAEVEKGSKVAIFGLGAVGLAVAMGAKDRGASQIIGIDLNPKKFETGKMVGVTDFINPNECDGKSLSQVITEISNGGVDYSFECIGIASYVEQAYDSTYMGWGKTIILGIDHSCQYPVCLPVHKVLTGKSLIGSLLGGIKPKSDIPVLLKKCENKELNLDPFITHHVGLDEINGAFDLLKRGESIRCIIWMNK